MSTEESLMLCPICSEKIPQGYILCPYCGADLTATYEAEIYNPVTAKDVFFRMFFLLVRPKRIIKDIANNPDSRGGLFFSLIISLGIAMQLTATLNRLSILYGWRSFVFFLVMLVTSFLLPIILWLLTSLFIRILCRLLGSRPTRKQTRSAVGYAMLPVALVQLFNGLFYFIALPRYTPDVGDLESIIASVAATRNSFAGILGLILQFASFVATGVYIVLILKPAANFSWLEASLATAIPIIAFIILLITYYFI